MRLIPSDQRFFDQLTDLASRIPTAAALVQDLFADPTRLDELVAAVKDLEHAADAVTHDIVSRLDTTFVTPLDREDIHGLATKLDTVIDLLDGTVRRAQRYRITAVDASAAQLAAVLVRAATALAMAVAELRHPKAVIARTREVKRLEEEADTIYHAAVGRLFEGDLDAIEVIKWKDIYDVLEDAADECHHAAQVLESVAIKQG